MNRVVSFSSGKGGVGKTTVVANLGKLWAQSGKKILVVDGDWALGKMGIVLGVRPQWTVEKVLQGTMSLEEVIAPVGKNLWLLGAPSGLMGFEELSESARNQLYFELEKLWNRYDFILLDHSSGIHWSVLQFAAAAHHHVVITTMEPTSCTDAYAIMKLLSKHFGIRDFSLLVTMSNRSMESKNAIARFSDVTQNNLQVRLRLLDVFPWDPQVSESIRAQQPFVSLFPQSELTSKFKKVCRLIEQIEHRPLYGLDFFYRQQKLDQDERTHA